MWSLPLTFCHTHTKMTPLMVFSSSGTSRGKRPCRHSVLNLCIGATRAELLMFQRAVLLDVSSLGGKEDLISGALRVQVHTHASTHTHTHTHTHAHPHASTQAGRQAGREGGRQAGRQAGRQGPHARTRARAKQCRLAAHFGAGSGTFVRPTKTAWAHWAVTPGKIPKQPARFCGISCIFFAWDLVRSCNKVSAFGVFCASPTSDLARHGRDFAKAWGSAPGRRLRSSYAHPAGGLNNMQHCHPQTGQQGNRDMVYGPAVLWVGSGWFDDWFNGWFMLVKFQG